MLRSDFSNAKEWSQALMQALTKSEDSKQRCTGQIMGITMKKASTKKEYDQRSKKEQRLHVSFANQLNWGMTINQNRNQPRWADMAGEAD